MRRRGAAGQQHRPSASPPPPTSGFRPDIEGLRAIAVLAVVFYHANVGFLSGGYVGVDVFYVISGFLITELLWREVDGRSRLSFAGFYARRARRILPAAMLVLVVTMIASLRLLPPLADALGLEGRSLERPVRRQLPLRRHQDQLPGRLDALARSSTTGRSASRSSSTWSGPCCWW